MSAQLYQRLLASWSTIALCSAFPSKSHIRLNNNFVPGMRLLAATWTFCWMHCVLFVHSFRYDSQTSFYCSPCFSLIHVLHFYIWNFVCVCFCMEQSPVRLKWIYFYFSANLKWLIRRVILDALKELSNNHLSWRFFLSKKIWNKNCYKFGNNLTEIGFMCFLYHEFPETFQRIANLRRKRFNAFSKIQLKRCAAYDVDG